MKYADVVIKNNSDKTDRLYTYGFDDSDDILSSIRRGSVVEVPFGLGSRLKEAYVFSVHDDLEKEIKGLKYIEGVKDEISFSDEIVDTVCWMRNRYLVKYFDGISCFLPPGDPSKRGKKRNPFKDAEGEAQETRELTQEQKTALKEINSALSERKRELFLLHGVTGSGKTEIYMRACEKALSEGRTAVMMVPEISLTKQTIERFIGKFGSEKIAVLHSRLSLGERYDEWIRIRSGEARIVIGARSAVFAPLDNIGIIIMDEEHETSYKSDMTPKYDTVEVAVKRLSTYGGVLVLGSATPSIVSNSRADEGIYRRLTLKKRYNEVALPKVEIIDMRDELREGNLSVFSRTLLSEMKKSLERKEQVILFLNRRGYSNFVSCRECGESIKCPQCGITLTYHKDAGKLVCHYCGYEEGLPEKCPSCGSRYIKYFGIGTEQVEEITREMFPDCSIERLDLDTTRRKGSTEKVLERFAEGKTDILIGTQIVAKGLDFRNIGLVGIISADVTLNIPDFRAPERTFQLITQAAGRAGRGDKRGRVVIQSYTPDNYAITHAADHDYDGFFKAEDLVRKSMLYPPYSDLIRIVFSSKDEDSAFEAGKRWENEIKRYAESTDAVVFALQPAPMSRIKDTYRFSLVIKSPKGTRTVFSSVIRKLKSEYLSEKKPGYMVSVDFNPYSFM